MVRQPTRQLLVIAHGHPLVSRGGGEHAAYALHQAFQKRVGWRSFFLGACRDRDRFHGQQLKRLDPEQEALFEANGAAHQSIVASTLDLSVQGELARLVAELQPDVIHLHHVLHLGLAAIAALRQWAPQARILLTLHEFLLLCPWHGQLRTIQGELCSGPTLEGCLDCCPWMQPADWLIRQESGRELQHWVDLFISPSQTLVTQFVANGWPAEMLCVVENVLPASFDAAATSYAATQPQPLHQVFGFFGNCREVKGLDLILQAWQQVVRHCPAARLQVHGPVQQLLKELALSHRSEDRRYAERLTLLLEQLQESVQLCGSYEQEQIPERMAGLGWVLMSSRWLENSPVVIQEAKACGRPLLVPALGGMAEKVQDGVDGWHVPVNDPEALANRMLDSCKNPEAWIAIQKAVLPPLALDQLLAMHEALYLAPVLKISRPRMR